MEGPYRPGQPAPAPYPEIGSDLSYRDHDAPIARMANRLLLDLVDAEASLLRVSGDGYAMRVGDTLRPHDVGTDDPGAARAIRARFALMAGLLPPEAPEGAVIPEQARGWIRVAFASEGGAMREHDSGSGSGRPRSPC